MSKHPAPRALKQSTKANEADLADAIKTHGVGSPQHVQIALKILRQAIENCE